MDDYEPLAEAAQRLIQARVAPPWPTIYCRNAQEAGADLIAAEPKDQEDYVVRLLRGELIEERGGMCRRDLLPRGARVVGEYGTAVEYVEPVAFFMRRSAVDHLLGAGAHSSLRDSRAANPDTVVLFPEVLARGVNDAQAKLYGTLVRLAARGACDPALEELATAVGCTRRQVQRNLQALEDAGCIRIHDRRPKRNRYELLVPT